MRRLFAAVCLVVCCASISPTRASTPPPGRFSGAIHIQDVTDAHMKAAIGKIKELVNNGDREIFLKINSFGGSVFAGYFFIQEIEELRKTHHIKVTCAVDVKSYSMGFALLQTICDTRLMTKRSTLLAHNASTSSEGNANQLESDLLFLRALDRSLAEMISKRLGMTAEAYMDKVRTGDWTMTWVDATAAKAIDGTIEPADIPAVYELKVKKSLFDFLSGG